MGENQNIFVEQVKQVNSQETVGYIATAINAMILVAVLWGAVSHSTLLIWFAAMALLTLIRCILYFRSKKIPTTVDNASQKAIRFRFGLVLAGIGWGTAGIVLVPGDSIPHQVFIAFVLGGMVAGAVGAFSALKSAFLTFSVPALLPLILHFFLSEDYICIAMGGMLLLFAVLTYATSVRIHQHIHTTLRLRFENRALIKDLEIAKSSLEDVNKQLRVEIDERKQAEQELKSAYDDLKSTQDQLVQSAKLASIGELASGVAHELNQPLTALRFAVQILQRNIDKGETNPEGLSAQVAPMERHTKRMINIINHLRTFSRKSQTGFFPQNINAIIDGALQMIGEQLRHKEIEIKLNQAQNLPPVIGDKNQIEQVVLNLITNARDAIEAQSKTDGVVRYPKGTLEISTVHASDDSGGVEILVKDTGNGIPQDHLDQLFTPFFTTKSEGKGTGLGLSISLGIIKDHHGEIEVLETGSHGTTFRIRLQTASQADTK